MKNVMENIMASPFFYAIIVTIAAFVAAYGSYKTNKRINRTYDEVVAIQQKTIETKDEIIGFMTGGDSFPEIIIIDEKFYVYIMGDYGIPNMKLDIYYLSNYNKILPTHIKEYLNFKKENPSAHKIFECDNQVFASRILTDLPVDLREYLQLTTVAYGFDFFFSTPYKKWTQRIRFQYINNKWEYISVIELLNVSHKPKIFSGSHKIINCYSTTHFPGLHEIENNFYFDSCNLYSIEKNKTPFNIKIQVNRTTPPLTLK